MYSSNILSLYGNCYSLDFQCSFQTHVSEDWVPGWRCWEGVELGEVKTPRRPLNLRVSSEGACIPNLFLLALSLCPVAQDRSRVAFPCAPAVMCCLTTAQSNGANASPPKLWAQTTFSFCQLTQLILVTEVSKLISTETCSNFDFHSYCYLKYENIKISHHQRGPFFSLWFILWLLCLTKSFSHFQEVFFSNPVSSFLTYIKQHCLMDYAGEQ